MGMIQSWSCGRLRAEEDGEEVAREGVPEWEDDVRAFD